MYILKYTYIKILMYFLIFNKDLEFTVIEV